jgi:hypothetical protein
MCGVLEKKLSLVAHKISWFGINAEETFFLYGQKSEKYGVIVLLH